MSGHTRSSTWCSLRALGPVKRCAIVVRGGGYCAWCRAPLTQETTQIDHVIPRRDGGPASPDNLVPACDECNLFRPDVPGDLEQLREPLDLGAGLQLALVWYPWVPARLEDRNARWRESAAKKARANREAEAGGWGGAAFPFGATG